MALLLGVIGLVASLFSYSFELQNIRISLLFAPIFPLLAAMAWGMRGALLAGVASFWFLFPFWLWPDNGYGNLASVVQSLLWLIVHGWSSDQRKRKSAWWNHPVLVQMFLIPFNYLLIVNLELALMSWNPAPWAPFSHSHMTHQVAEFIFIKNSINMVLLVAVAHALLALPFLRKMLRLDDGGKSARYNVWIFLSSIALAMLLTFLIGISVKMLEGSAFSISLFWQATPSEVVTAFLLFSVSMLAGGSAARFVENRLRYEAEINSNLEVKHQELAYKNEDLEALLYMVSHDVRTPLVNIRGFAMELRELLRDPVKVAADPEVYRDVQQSLQFIDTGAQRLSAIASGALRIARLGRGDLHPQVIHPNEIVAEALDGMQYQIQETGTHVHVSEMPSCIGDKGFFLQVITNLVDNAIKYRGNEESGARIEIYGYQNEKWCTYTIRDHGPMIPEFQRGRIFEPLFRIDRHSRISGQGLGLAIARRLLSLQGGRIWVEAAEHGDGNRFCLTLPAPGK